MFLSENEIKQIKFKSVGKNVLISNKVSFYNPEQIEIGNNVRIDDFSILTGDIKIGNYVHISAGCKLYGKGGIEIGNFCGMSANSIIYSACDDFSGEYMISPMVPECLTNVNYGKVTMCDYCQLGANTIIMPNVIMKEGAVTGTFSFVNKNLKEWSINFGIPCKFYKKRCQNAKKIFKGLLSE